MPFCRECGKEVEHDWVTCPYCSQTIGPPNLNSQSVQDSVIMGDVNTNINDSDSISEAMKATLKCPNCHSSGAILFGCKNCGEHTGCSLCIDQIVSSRHFSMREHSKDIEWYFNYVKDSTGMDHPELYNDKCQSCWNDEKELLIASETQTCFNHKQEIIAERKRVLAEKVITTFHITKKDMETIFATCVTVTEIIESYLSHIADSAFNWIEENVFNKDLTGYNLSYRRSTFPMEYGYTNEYVTDKLKLMSIDTFGRPVMMPFDEWNSYVTTLVPLQGYKGRQFYFGQLDELVLGAHICLAFEEVDVVGHNHEYDVYGTIIRFNEEEKTVTIKEDDTGELHVGLMKHALKSS